MKISFTTTSLCRPEISKTSLDSLEKSIDVSLKNFTVYLNIDPFPDPEKADEVEYLFSQYFGTVISNKPSSANFSKAVKWCWSNAESDFIFHYEDDWLFLESFKLDDLLFLFGPDIHQVNFRCYDFIYGACKTMPLSPSIFKKECYKTFAKGFDDNINPETQTKDYRILPLAGDDRVNQIKTYGEKAVVQDIGRAWGFKNDLRPCAGLEKPKFIKY